MHDDASHGGGPHERDEIRSLLRRLPQPASDEAFPDAVLARLDRRRRRRSRLPLLAAGLAGAGLFLATTMLGRGPLEERPGAVPLPAEARLTLEELRRDQARIAGELEALAALRREPVYLGGSETIDVVWRPLAGSAERSPR